MIWKRLLVPHDFSTCAARATFLAVELAAVHGASITLLHVSALPPNLAPSALVTPPGEKHATRVDDYVTAGARAELDAVAAPLRARGLDVRTVALASTSGDIADAILRAAADLDVQAVVLGTHGRTGLSHFVVGSVAEKVVRQAAVPVITVRSPAPAAKLTLEERAAEDELVG